MNGGVAISQGDGAGLEELKMTERQSGFGANARKSLRADKGRKISRDLLSGQEKRAPSPALPNRGERPLQEMRQG